MHTEQEQSFHSLLKQHYDKMHGCDSLQKARESAWKQYCALGLPSKQSEVFRYIKLKNLFSSHYQIAATAHVTPTDILPHIYPESRESFLVFVNGHYISSLSNIKGLPDRVAILPLTDAIKTYGPFLNNQWNQWIKEECDPFAMLNAALHQAGIFIYLPPKCVVESPIQIIHLIDAQSLPLLMMPKIQIFSGAHSQAIFSVSTIHHAGNHYCINQMTDLTLEEGAHLQYAQIEKGLPDVWMLDAVRANLKRNSSFKCVHFTDGAATVRHDYRLTLTGENAEASLNGVWVLSQKKEAHSNVLVDHRAPHCRSTQLFKGVLSDLSRSSFEGKILVQKEAQKTDAFQLNNNLLLSDRANADSKPNLEIFADDVKASHGATIGQLDNDLLFYMKARGLKEKEAKNFLVESFCREVIDQIPIDSLKANLVSFFK